MIQRSGGKSNSGYFICFLLIWVVQMAAAFYFCTQKQGFHEDEYYTYYATARTNGFYVEDGQWMDRGTYRDEFVVLPDQRFQYGLVKLVQSWDVHPPMYYWVFHTVASLLPGVFSKWIGLSVNLFFHGINIILLTYLSYFAGGRDRKLSLLATLFFGLSPAAMSGVVFIRMYEMLTTSVLACAILHVRAMEVDEEKLPVLKCLVPMAVVTYIGFLTQYYYFIFLFYLAATFGVWLLWRDRNLRNCIRYGISQGLAFGLAYATYPSCLGQMFRGQRGAQATENFFDLSNTLERFAFFYELLDVYVFGKMFPVALLVIVLLWVTVYRRERMQKAVGAGAAYWSLAFAAVSYFLTVSKTALLLGDTSNRYQLPVYGIVVFLTFRAVQVLWRQVCAYGGAGNKKTHVPGKRDCRRIMMAVIVIACVSVDMSGLMSGKVVFLYPEDQEQVAYAAERAAENTPVVYLYQPGAEWCIWDVANELFAYPEIYFVAAEGDDVIEDGRIQAADSVVVYAADGIDTQGQIARIRDSNPELAECWRVFEEKYCDVYYLMK